MFYVTELQPVDPRYARSVNIPWGRGATIPGAVCNAAHNITDETEGLIDHVNNMVTLGLYMQHTGSQLVLSYVDPATLDPIKAYKLP